MMKKSKALLFSLVIMTVAGFTILVSGAALAACPDGIVAYWKLNETAAPYTDFIGGKIGSENVTAPTPLASGVVTGDGAQTFDGSIDGDGIDIPASRTFNWLSSESFSIEFWINMPAAPASENQVVMGRVGDAGDPFWYVGVTPAGVITFVLSDGSPEITTTGAIPITGAGAGPGVSGGWHHVVVVRDSSTETNLIYVDGELDVSAGAIYTAGGGFMLDAAALNIGWLNFTGVGQFRLAGSLDEIALYDRALSNINDEIFDHFTAGQAGTDYCGGSPAPDVPGDAPYPDKTISFWPLNETDGTNGYADIPGGNNGSENVTAPTPLASGVVTGDGAQTFDGSIDGDGIDIPASRTFNWLSSESFSIEFWINMPAAPASENQVVMGRVGDAGDPFWYVGVTPAGVITFVLSDGSPEITTTGAIPITGAGAGPGVSGGWHHVVVVRDSSTETNLIYVDGELDVSAGAIYTAGGGFMLDAAALNIGWLNFTGVGQFRLAGSLDEIALYDRALSNINDEILDHFDAGSNGEPVTSLRPNPVANAGIPQEVTEGDPVELIGTGTPGYTAAPIATYLWTQTVGTTVVLTGDSTATATFTAPDVSADETLTFRLTVTAVDGLSSSNETNVTVRDSTTAAPTPPATSGGGGGGGCFINSLF
jgi:hypothetical protein